MRDHNNSNRYSERPSVDRRRALLIERTAGSRRFIWDTQMSTKRFLRLVVRSAKRQHETPRQNVTAFKGGDGAVNDPDQKMHTYEVHPRTDHHGVNLISEVLPFGRLLYLEVREAVAYAKFYSRSHDATIRVYDIAGNVIETHEHKAAFKE